MNQEEADCQELLVRATAATNRLRERLVELSDQGRRMDAYQVPARRLATLASELRAAQSLAQARGPAWLANAAVIAAGEVLQRAQQTFVALGAGLDMPPTQLESALFGDAAQKLLTRALAEARYRALGRAGLAGELGDVAQRLPPTEGDAAQLAAEVLASTHRFGREVVAPLAQTIHVDDTDVPEAIIEQMAALGFFGMSVPEAYGGSGLGNLAMILATEALSEASLGAAGSLITRPEVITKALVAGGTEAQKQRWLPAIASGEVMTAVSVTEPDVGSDVANLRCRAEPAERGGEQGYVVNGAKAWCTFAGRANLLGVLARTEGGVSGHRGLSLLLVEKPACSGHEFRVDQPGGGQLAGKADRTLGYRGMHSFTLAFKDFFVPMSHVVGGEAGLGRGFYYQMAGFAAGRLQTGGRAVGLTQAALDVAIDYVQQRRQFGKPLADYQSTHYELGCIVVALEGARQLTYAAAVAMDAGDPQADLWAAMAKRVACRVAVQSSQRSQLLHGGWGYAEEFPIARHVADALVLPIFEGVEPILEMKVIARELLRGNG